MANLTGQIINGYLIQEELGRGGMGVVFKAQQLSIDRPVAIKFLNAQRAGDERAVARFLREARASGKLAHPNVVAVYDAGQAEGLHYLVMEYVDGPSAFKLLREHGPLTETETLRIAANIAEALRFAHSKGVLHRDVKPDNFLLDSRGHVKLADLGLARFMTGPGSTELTQDGAMLGTPHYMSPEQCKASDVDARSDLYSLGASMYMLAAGRPPFEGPGPGAVIARVLTDPPVPLRKHNPLLSPGFCALVDTLMQKDPAKRCATAEEALSRITALSQRNDAPKPALGAPAGASRRRGLQLKPMLFGGLCALVFLIMMARNKARQQHLQGTQTVTSTSTDVVTDASNATNISTAISTSLPTTTATNNTNTQATTATETAAPEIPPREEPPVSADPREAQAQALFTAAQQAWKNHDRSTVLTNTNKLVLHFAETRFVKTHRKEIDELPTK